MAQLEAEAMLLGIWRSVEELELTISLQELEAILDAAREKEMRDRRFAAALKGVNLDSDASDAKEKVEEMKRKAQAMKDGMGEDQFELDDLGLDFEEED